MLILVLKRCSKIAQCGENAMGGGKIQQVNLPYPPGKVAITCRELQYHGNLPKNKSKKKKKKKKTPKFD